MDKLSNSMRVWGIVLAIVVIVGIMAGVLYSYYHTKSSTTFTPTSELRIVSLAPSDTQILIALGLGKYIVGMDYYSYSLLQYLNLTSEVPKNVTVLGQIYPQI